MSSGDFKPVSVVEKGRSVYTSNLSILPEWKMINWIHRCIRYWQMRRYRRFVGRRNTVSERGLETAIKEESMK